MHKSYQIDLPVFTGPLDLLLHLIERQELDITAISLAHVTEQYLEQIENLKEDKVEQLIDFLVIGARLVLIKSRALLPRPPAVLAGDEEEEDPAEVLARQLRLYKRFKEAAVWLAQREAQGLRTYLRVAPPPKLESKLDLSGVTADSLIAAMRAALARMATPEDSVSLVEGRTLTIETQIERIRSNVKEKGHVSFRSLLAQEPSPLDVAVTLLAVLELIKRREISAYQPVLFGPIELGAIVAANGQKG